MIVLLAQLAPRRGELRENLYRLRAVLEGAGKADLAVFPELYLAGYTVGERHFQTAVARSDATEQALIELAKDQGTSIVVGGSVQSVARKGEIHNAALLIRSDGSVEVQSKRYLPTYGPFVEGSFFTPAGESHALSLDHHRLGIQICYDAFFPEISRELALDGADLLVVISAAPTTSRKLFDKVLPARAVENATPLVYVNRVGVEDGLVFGGGSDAWDARGEVVPGEMISVARGSAEESMKRVEIDLNEAHRWRPFRPVLRDVSSRPPTSISS